MLISLYIVELLISQKLEYAPAIYHLSIHLYPFCHPQPNNAEVSVANICNMANMTPTAVSQSKVPRDRRPCNNPSTIPPYTTE